MKSLKVFLLGFVLISALGTVVLAQEEIIEPTNETEVEKIVNLDEDVQPADLGISEPQLLPDSPFYFLKDWTRGIRSFFTFNPVKKAELRMKFANEKLMEAKKIVQKTQDPEIIKKVTENYQQEVEKIKNQVEKIKEKAKDNPEVDKFLNKFIGQQTLHQKLLQQLETQVPPEVFEKIKEARERHLERFKDVMLKLEDRKEKITEKLGDILEKQKGSQFKNFKNLEILKELENKVPEEAKEAIRKAQENALKRLKGNLEQMSPEDQERFKEYLEKISGNKERQMEILENLKEELKDKPEIKEKLLQAREKILERVKEKIQEKTCPAIEKPAAGFCQEGRIILKKDEKGCIVSFECVIPAEIEIPEKPEKPIACITLWNPVCGKNGKTYSNACFAKLAGVEIDYKGICRKCGPCPQLAPMHPVLEAKLRKECEEKGGKFEAIKDECGCYGLPGCIMPSSVETPVCKNLCGDGVCQEIVCMAIGCPCPESRVSCPTDCK